MHDGLSTGLAGGRDREPAIAPVAVDQRRAARSKMAEIYAESPSLAACNQKLAVIDKQIADLGQRSGANAARFDQLTALKAAVLELIALFETKRRQWTRYEALHQSISAELRTLLAEQPESLSQYPAYLSKIKALSDRLAHIAQRQKLFVGDESIKSHGVMAEVAPGIAVVAATKEFLGKPITALDVTSDDLDLTPSAEEKRLAEYFAKLHNRSAAAVRDFFDSTEYRDLRLAFKKDLEEKITMYRRELTNNNTPQKSNDADEVEEFLNLQFAKMAQFRTSAERQGFLNDLKIAAGLLCHVKKDKLTIRNFFNHPSQQKGIIIKLTFELSKHLLDVNQDSNAEQLARLKIGTEEGHLRFDSDRENDELNPFTLHFINVTSGSSYSRITESRYTGSGIAMYAGELLAEILPLLNRRQAKLSTTPRASVLEQPGKMPNLRVDTVNGNVELVNPPLPEINTIGALAYQKEQAEMAIKAKVATKALAEKQALYDQEDAHIRALVAQFEAACKLGSEIEFAYRKAHRLAEEVAQAVAMSQFAQAEHDKLRSEYDKLRGELKGIVVLKRKEKQATADALVEKLTKLTETTAHDPDTTDPYQKYALQANLDRKTSKELELVTLLATINTTIEAYQALHKRIREMTTAVTFTDPVKIIADANYQHGDTFHVAIERQKPGDLNTFFDSSKKHFAAMMNRLGQYEQYFTLIAQGKGKIIEAAKESTKVSNPFESK